MQANPDVLKGIANSYSPPPSNPYLEEKKRTVNFPPAPSPSDKQYKMGVGGRILGTVANFLSGFSGRGPVTYTGSGALNSRYNQDRQKWQTGYNDHQRRLNDLKPIYDQGAPSPAQPQDAANNPEQPSYQPGDTVFMGGRNHTVLETFPDGSMKIEPWATQEEDESQPMGPFYAPGTNPR
jgi:hypothetical protein